MIAFPTPLHPAVLRLPIALLLVGSVAVVLAVRPAGVGLSGLAAFVLAAR